MKACLSSNEVQRLETLHRLEVLDSAPEEAFDDLTLIAAQICQTPIAMVSLVDESRQWFKSRIGVTATETSRDLAFCAHAILHADEVMEVRDARADPRFADNPLVTSDPHIRFYAGAPLVTSDGHALGTLCVIDRVPRELSAAQLTALRALSRRAVAQFEMRRQARKLVAGERETKRLLTSTEASRRALLSLIEDQKRTVASLRSSEERFREIAENIQEVFWMTDVEKNQMIYVSPAYEVIWGRSPASLYATPHEWSDSIHNSDRARVIEAAVTKQATGDYDETYRIVRPDGTVRWVHDRAFPIRDDAGRVIRIVGTAEDITVRKQFEEQFLRAQRLESIGMLATGIAHDLNNVLAPIGIVTPLLRTDTTSPRDLWLLDTLERCADRGAGLVRQILGFAHGIGEEARLMQVNHLLRDIAGIVTETFPKSIIVETDFPNDVCPILANPTHIHQVVLNLCVNARDAMPAGGTLTLRAENCLLDADAAARIDGARSGAWIVLHVQDTGTGIPREVLARIWEPFFSTKGPDRGTGLGLSTVRGIVETHHGFITLQTAPGRGTTFRVYLPASGTDASGAGGTSPGLPARGHDELILLVDDEQAIRDTAGATLKHAGYRVLTAADGAEGAAIFEQHASEIALVVTDRDMPVLDGPALARIVHALNPAINVLAISGHAASDRGGDAPAETDADAFLSKPFTAQGLLDSVAQLLCGRALAH